MKVKSVFAALLAGCLLVSMSSCDKDESGPVDEGSVNAAFYFKGDLNGKALLLPEGKDGYESQAVAHEPITVSGCTNWQAMRLAKGLDLKKSLEVSFVKGTEACYTACAQVEAMYNTGSYSFGRVASGSNGGTTDGVIIRYIDVDGKVWSSDFGSGDQSGSSFSILEHISNTRDSKSKKVTTAEFNCKLYDGSGNIMQLTNGEIVSRSVQCGNLN